MSDINSSYNSDHSSSFDSTNSFYSTTTSDSQISNSHSNSHSLFDSIIQDEDLFNPKYQKQVAEMVDTFLSEISQDDNFQPLLDLPTVKLDTATNPATPFCFRVTANFTGHSAAAAFALFASVAQRAKWDAMCQSIQILKTIDPLTCVYHLKLKSTWPTAPRDSLMIAAFRKLTDGRFVSVAWSITDDSLCPPDPSQAYVRMHTRISANLFTPTGPASFILTQLIDADPKGSIPAYVIKKVSAKSFPATIESIKQAINPNDTNFYNQIIKKLKLTSEQESPATTDTEIDQTSNQLREIQSRLERIESHLLSINSNSNNTTQTFTQYAPIVLSSVSLLLLLNLNLRKQ